MRTIILLALGAIIGAVALGVVWSATDGDVTVRVAVQPLEDGRVEVGLQHQTADGQWLNAEQPQFRFLAADAERGRTLYSSEIVVPVESQAEQVENAHIEYLRSEGAALAEDFAISPAEEGAAPATTVLCVIDLRGAALHHLCDGLEEHFEGTVERVENENSAELRAYFDERLQNGDDIAGAFATSPRTAQIMGDAMTAQSFSTAVSYWIQLVDPLLPSSDSLYCVIGHGGSDVDFFWGLSGEAQETAFASLDVQLRVQSYTEIEDQVAAVRKCLDDGAAAVATTLSNPAAMQPVIDALRAADIPVVSYNSGAEAEAEVDTALHISLDDRQAGQIAGDEFNRRGFDGNVLCIIHEETNVGLEERCDGLESRYQGTVERFRLSTPDLWEQIELLQARFLEGGVDAIQALSVNTAFAVEYGVLLAETDIPRATFGFSLGTARRVARQDVMFTVFDHPELQSYLASSSTVLADRFRLDPSLFFQGVRLLIQPRVYGQAEMQAILDDLVADQ